MKRRQILGGLLLSSAASASGAAAASSAQQRTAAAAPDSSTIRGTSTVRGSGAGTKKVNIAGAVALVTGSNRGVGRGFVEVLLARGAKRVYATARNPKNLAEIVALDPTRVVPLELDIVRDDQRRAAAAQARDVTMLINNAAAPGSEATRERQFLAASSLDDMRLVMETNLWAPAELQRLLVPRILENSSADRVGAVVNILSAAALYCVPEFASYSVSKAANMMMTAAVRAETDRLPIIVASVFTGSVQTRSLPIGARNAKTPVEHANEVFDGLAQGLTTLFPAGGAITSRERVCQDPEGLERANIERFHTKPLRVAPY